jgi:putative oxidoreductase
MIKRLFDTGSYTLSLNMGLLLLRIGVCALMLTHGIPKLMKVVSGNYTFGDPLGIGSGASLVLATFAEVGCSLLILIGAGTRLVTLPLIVTMLIAALIAHGADPFGKKELPLLYLLIYTLLLFAGSGKYAVDHLISKRHRIKDKVY